MDTGNPSSLSWGPLALRLGLFGGLRHPVEGWSRGSRAFFNNPSSPELCDSSTNNDHVSPASAGNTGGFLLSLTGVQITSESTYFVLCMRIRV